MLSKQSISACIAPTSPPQSEPLVCQCKLPSRLPSPPLATFPPLSPTSLAGAALCACASSPLPPSFLRHVLYTSAKECKPDYFWTTMGRLERQD
jgi:hypothetical protein